MKNRLFLFVLMIGFMTAVTVFADQVVGPKGGGSWGNETEAFVGRVAHVLAGELVGAESGETLFAWNGIRRADDLRLTDLHQLQLAGVKISPFNSRELGCGVSLGPEKQKQG